MSPISSRPARRLLAVGSIVAVIAAFGVSAQTGLLSRSSASSAYKVNQTLQKRFPAALGNEPDRAGARQEGPVTTIEQQQYAARAFPQTDIPPAAYSLGTNQYNLVSNYLNGANNWRLLGPTYAPGAVYHDFYNGNALAASGRATAIAADPTTCRSGGCGTVYLGTANGGVWKTTNGGSTWAPLFNDSIFTNAVGAIAVDPVNPKIVYVGTGEPNFSGDSNRGLGIYRTTNGGTTWAQFGFNQFVNRAITAIVIDPRGAGNPSTTRLYVTDASGVAGGGATGGSGSAPYLPARGFYRSLNGGATWTRSNPGTAAPGSAYSLSNNPAHSLVMDPTNPNVLWAGFTSQGLFRSTDDGQTWSEIASGPANSISTTGLPGPNSGTADRYTLAISANGQTLYVAWATPGYSQRIYKTTNAQDASPSFTQLNAPNTCGGQCWYDMPLAISPTNANTLYVGGVATYEGYTFNGYGGPCSTLYPFPALPTANCRSSIIKTTDGGQTWRDISANVPSNRSQDGNGPLHPDAHAIFVNPSDPGNVYFANDGGLVTTSNATADFPLWTDLNRGLVTLQFGGVAVGPTGSVYGGTQDNGTFRLDPGNSVATHSFTGDGGQPMADPTDPNTAYYATYGATLLRDDNVFCNGCDPITRLYQDFGSTVTEIDAWPDTAGQFYQPHILAPAQPSVIFAGTNRILRSLNRGGTDGNGDGSSNNDASDSADGASVDGSIKGNWAPLSDPGTFGGGNISAIASSPTDPNILAVATTLGRIYITDNALATPTVDNASTCDARTQNDQTMDCNYVSGINWTRIDTSTLPGRFVSSLAFAPASSTTLYATYSGFAASTPGRNGHVFVTTNAGTSGSVIWTNLNGSGLTALPDLPFSSIVVNPKVPTHLYAAADVGVFYSPNGGRSWLRIDRGLPKVPVYQLVYNQVSKTLLAVTHGRGIWEGNAP